ncbi:hypothetical protein [Rathayibacter toxicus]|uniref:hypothetical protein n=1 Tax=Rathayibacter toxicus TaxID=145458 RepID=UPI0004807ABF|nr:hypothetical protein [Rathayibacter toxicus]PPH24831.1 hypothetical protein C5D17_02320 [Rathayibacter toxicus]PPH58756.1 hypothetical protein C5D30_02335 [Rathayibacter toxicus]PPH60751.1 hypothetical protein C5C93_02370 [Rathayibacter toxicus]PPH88571.1 hypothetical protein C5D31_02345 [Rathayibacter toxicus]PPI32884.1 hypothetical protein C5D65_02330 [Rathayibacter toxicus]
MSLLSAAFALFAGPLAAHTSVHNGVLTSHETDHLVEFFDTFGVPQGTQARLIDEFEIGGESSPGDVTTFGGFRTLGVDDCGYSLGAQGNFVNCHIYYRVGTVQSGFYANFTITTNGPDAITSVWGGSFTALGSCSQSVPDVTIVTGRENAAGHAIAGYAPQATMCLTNYSTSFPSYLHVGADSAQHVYS